ncbi:MAG: ATP-binding protein, partial [Candidatus Edwardsbacteria bacterium]|nr:ATP-binding protein [Candidatus Edwardsbacteria bacterium]
MITKDAIVKIIRSRKTVTGRDLTTLLGISRQAVNKRIRLLIGNGVVTKIGSTHNAHYVLTDGKSLSSISATRTFALKGLEEDAVFTQLAMNFRLEKTLQKNAFRIVRYTFLEMLNNAIEHSRGDRCDITISVDPYTLRYTIRDYGIGLFASVAAKYRMADEQNAVGAILKGKTTTDPSNHSGEGIFFSSKLADRMSFRSHALELTTDNLQKDAYTAQKKYITGTLVSFEIRRKSRRDQTKIFNCYSPEKYDHRFDRTGISVKLASADYISRSEARRLLAGL